MIKFLQYVGVASIGIALPMLLPMSALYAPVFSSISSGVVVAQEQEKAIILTPFLLQNINKQSRGSEQLFLAGVRRVIISKLVSEGFSGFATKYPEYNLLLGSGGIAYHGTGSGIAGLDQLDFWLKQHSLPDEKLLDYKFQDSLRLPVSIYQGWKGIELFQSYEDLQQLGYQVVSYRTRMNNDAIYRRHNIATAFWWFGNIRVINPGQTVSFYKNIAYDPTVKKRYKSGKIIKDDQEIPEYGGGLCGASTAIYQGMVTNKSLERLQVRNHSKWYHTLYSAVINGEKVTTPGVDSTIYDGAPDLVFQNTSEHPIVVVSNYLGAYGEQEENFTLGFASDKGSLEYIGSEPKNFVIDGKKRTGKCYTWNINGVERKSCYNQLK